jgi:hypothetical protein
MMVVAVPIAAATIQILTLIKARPTPITRASMLVATAVSASNRIDLLLCISTACASLSFDPPNIIRMPSTSSSQNAIQ